MRSNEPSRPPDWQLPSGVDRALWDYTHSTALAESYDEANADAPILTRDIPFIEKHLLPGSRVLDLGCGSGRVLVTLAGKGHSLTGIDLSPPMLSVCQAKLARLGLAATLIEGNICDLSLVDLPRFDAVLLMFSTLGMVVGREQRAQVLHEAHRLLREGGVLILHLHSRWSQRYSTPGRRWLVWDGIRRCWGACDAGDVVQPPVRGVRGLRIHLFGRKESRKMLRRAGFQPVDWFAVGHQPDGSLNHPHARTMLPDGWLISARKSSLPNR